MIIMKTVTANGRAKVKGSFTPNFGHRYEKIGESMMRELNRTGWCLVYNNPTTNHIITELVRLGIVCRYPEGKERTKVRLVAELNRQPQVKKPVIKVKKSNWRRKTPKE